MHKKLLFLIVSTLTMVALSACTAYAAEPPMEDITDVECCVGIPENTPAEQTHFESTVIDEESTDPSPEPTEVPSEKLDNTNIVISTTDMEYSDESTENNQENPVYHENNVIPEETVEQLPESTIALELIIKRRPDSYFYTDMLKDIDVLETKYPGLVSVYSIAKTPDERNIWVFRIGSQDANHKVLIHAGIHAREYITCQLVMEQMCDFLKDYSENAIYKGYTMQELMQDTAIYVIPMVNPDGMSISQLGLDGVQTSQVKEQLQAIANADDMSFSDAYLTNWKANANGVDLNRNFDALWGDYVGVGHISSDHYKGDYAGSESESNALIRLTEQEGFERTISYHAQGSVIYWYFGQSEPLYSATHNFAKRLSDTTGYWLDANFQSLDPAGYKDWCLYRMNIPSVTIEVGHDITPVPHNQYEQIYLENANVFRETLIDLVENHGEV